MYDLNGKVALVTGTSAMKGIGSAIARRLASDGADVVVSDKYKSPDSMPPWEKDAGWLGLESLAAEIEAMGRRSMAVFTDIRNRQEVEDMVQKTVDEFGKIDIVVNNAAVITKDIGNTPVVEMPEDTWKLAMDVNLTGTFLMCKTVARQMIKQNHGGKIINISSINGKRATKGLSAYSASKFGIIGLTQALALELAPYKIHANAVCPGWIDSWGTAGPRTYAAVKEGLSEEEAAVKVYITEGTQKPNIPLGKPGRVEDVAGVVAFLASGQSDYMTGQAINVTGGLLVEH